ncbi:hypothetical protein ACFPN7_10840 [Amycolatopsis halotolerans]|uniref:hypothetical protein n=1 Tax=Amycolatopsis halotolerans TaxID=330083 RepID=UPI003608883D
MAVAENRRLGAFALAGYASLRVWSSAALVPDDAGWSGGGRVAVLPANSRLGLRSRRSAEPRSVVPTVLDLCSGPQCGRWAGP